MTNTIILLAILVVEAVFVGLVMETYKKLVRDGRSGIAENRVVAFLLSLVMGFVTYEVVDLSEITSMIRDSMWVALAYGILIYVGQYETCMKVWKPVVKKWIQGRANE